MAKLAIKGHATRGQEVIEILKMLGGKNYDNHNGAVEWAYFIDMSCHACHYYIDGDGNIECSHVTGIPFPGTFFTLEEFLEKFPYKVGDSVSSKYLKNYKIEKAEWANRGNRVIYKLQGVGWHSVEDLQPYKEETMEEQKKDYEEWFPTDYLEFENNDDTWADEVEINLGQDHEIQFRGDKTFIVKKKPQYPKTYVECAKMLNCFGAAHIDGYKGKLLEKLQELIVCRDAYWKIAGEQMGLGKPWEPDWVNDKQQKFFITTFNSQIELNLCATHSYVIGRHNHILAFPTEEMQDAFYENFKELIEECKEFL